MVIQVEERKDKLSYREKLCKTISFGDQGIKRDGRFDTGFEKTC